MKIAIDIGHARATGASGNGLQEHAVCNGLAAFLADDLESHFEVLVVDFPKLSNSGDLRETVREINEYAPALSVSLHCDSSQNATACGAHVIYVSEAGRAAAVEIAGRLCPLMPGRANRTVKQSDLYVLNNTRCPAVLVECGFLTNTRDADMLRYEGQRLARAIASGVREWARRREMGS